jgi:hypothetical protein
VQEIVGDKTIMAIFLVLIKTHHSTNPRNKNGKLHPKALITKIHKVLIPNLEQVVQYMLIK